MGGPAEPTGTGTGRGRAGAPRPGGPNKVVVALAHGLGRYRYGLALASAVLLGLALLPSSRPDGAAAGNSGGGTSRFTVIDPSPGKRATTRRPNRPSSPTPETTAEAGPAATGPDGPRSAVDQPATTTTTTAGRAGTALGAGGEPVPGPGPACDPATGRLAVPSRFAPPCVAPVRGNGGATWPGVTAMTVTVAVYLPRGDVASSTLSAATGNKDTADEVAATYRSYADYFEHHYQTWGRRVRLVFVTASGADDDATAARADAVRVAGEIGAFASWGGPARTSAYADELAARRVLCICAVPEPDAWYSARAPYVLSPEPTVSQRITLQAEYVARRLAGRPARHAGDLTVAAETRTFGLVYEDSPHQAGLRGAEALERALRRAGVELLDSLGFGGGEGGAAAGGADARRVVSRLRQAGVTSVLYVGDGLFPVFMTQEATRQGYGPEWVLLGPGVGGVAGAAGGGPGGGLAGADTTFAARTYDQTQWAHAFGLSFSGARVAPGQGEAWRVHAWHTGSAPPARASHVLIYRAPWLFFTGMHLGGPGVTPASIRDGLFGLPPAGRGMVTSPSVSFGRHGLWPGDDHGAADDVTELWWDPTAAGPDESDASGVGMYRYVDGGRRYLPGRQPPTETAAFNRSATVTVYEELPPSDRPPSYPHHD